MEKNKLQTEWEKVNKDQDAINLIDTNFHENGFILPKEMLSDFTSDYFSNRMYRPDSKGSLLARKSISDHYAKSDIHIDPENILITASSSESYNLLFNNLTKPGDNILLPLPGYPLFEFIANFNHIETKFYDMDPNNQFKIDMDSIRSAIDEKTKMLVLISPNNPTGQIIDSQTMNEITHLCCSRDIMLVSDEVFSEFVYDNKSFENNEGLLPRPASNRKATVFTLNGISKMFASPDLKLSWICVSGDTCLVNEIMDQLEVSNDVFLSCNSLSQYILPQLFANCKPFVKEMVNKLNRNRKAMIDIFSKCNNISVIQPKAGIHCVIKLCKKRCYGNYDSEDFAVDLVKSKKLYLHPGYFYGLDDGVYGVISFLKENSLFIDGLSRLVDFAES